jgi:hypothetical protein
MGLALGMRIDAHGRLIAPAPQTGTALNDYGLDDEGQPESLEG